MMAAAESSSARLYGFRRIPEENSRPRHLSRPSLVDYQVILHKQDVSKMLGHASGVISPQQKK